MRDAVSMILPGLQAVQDKVAENSALLKEVWEGQRMIKQLQHALTRQKHHSHTLQQEYDLLRHQVSPNLLPSCVPCPQPPLTSLLSRHPIKQGLLQAPYLPSAGHFSSTETNSALYM